MEKLPESISKYLNEDIINAIEKYYKTKFQEHEKKINYEILSNNIKNDVASNPHYTTIADDFKYLLNHGVNEILDIITGYNDKNITEHEMRDFINRYIFYDCYDNIDTTEIDTNTKNKKIDLDTLSNNLKKKLFTEINKKFKIQIPPDSDLDLRQFIKMAITIKQSDPKIWFIGQYSPKAEYNTIEHKSENKIYIERVITPGIKVNNFVLVRAEVTVIKKLTTIDGDHNMKSSFTKV